jgi:hypothetical protein
MEPPFKLRSDQQRLTPEQRAEVERFAAQCARHYLSTEPVDEEAAEAFLWQAYEVVGLTPPRHIHWLDGPLELVAVLARGYDWIYVDDEFTERVSHCVWDDTLREQDEINFLKDYDRSSVDYRVRSAQQQAEAGIQARFGLRWGLGLAASVWNWLNTDDMRRVRTDVSERIWRAVAESARWSLGRDIRDSRWDQAGSSIWHSILAFEEARMLAFCRFFDTYVAPNEGRALAHFNELVSGYWFGKEVALIVRRPRLLSCDIQGRLHNATGKCVEYPDGWGFYAWHGVRAPEKVILAPESLTREDFLNERNIEARRLIQERMGQRFVWELEGKFIDGGPQGVLYEVDLPGDPERVARYVHVQDASTPHQYYLRVPPTIQTVAEAIAWSFNMSVEEYHPAKET